MYWNLESKSVIDYIVVSIVKEMTVDEGRIFTAHYQKKEKNDLRTIYSDHNAIVISICWKNIVLKNVNEKINVMTKNGLKKYKNGEVKIANEQKHK